MKSIKNRLIFCIGGTIGGKKTGVKKASLFAWMTLQSVPEETTISPHILEFLEQTLEPIPIKSLNDTGEINNLKNYVTKHRRILLITLYC